MMKIPTPMRARGFARAATTPTSVKAKGPWTLNRRQPREASSEEGRFDSETTSESSSEFRVTEKNSFPVAQSGMADSGDSLTFANNTGITESVRVRLVGGMCG